MITNDFKPIRISIYENCAANSLMYRTYVNTEGGYIYPQRKGLAPSNEKEPAKASSIGTLADNFRRGKSFAAARSCKFP